MGEMADMTLEMCSSNEALLDEYCNGSIDYQDAYDYGFIDEMGIEQEGVEAGWDRNPIPTLANLQQEMRDAEQMFNSAELRMSAYNRVRVHPPTTTLNRGALANLKKDRPTCNICEEQMQKQTGKFGVFFYCGNYCEGQKTVSEKYWNSIRVKGNEEDWGF